MALVGRMAARAFTRKTTGLDGMVKKLMARQAGPVEHDPDLDHYDADWLVPGPIETRPTT
jgi:hypothetical protein